MITNDDFETIHKCIPEIVKIMSKKKLSYTDIADVKFLLRESDYNMAYIRMLVDEMIPLVDDNI